MFNPRSIRFALAITLTFLIIRQVHAADPWVVYEGKAGPGHGKNVVLISGDEEYRSEEALPQLAKILAKHHGFKCTVLFAVNDEGTIDPNRTNNIPGLEALKSADLMIVALRFRNLPAEQMKYIVEYLDSGRPVIGMRTATHSFKFPKESPFAKYSFDSKEKGWAGGFGRHILGETWVSHHGQHGKQSTRGLIAKGEDTHPILKGIADGTIWGATDVYGVHLPLAGDSKPIVMGEVLEGMSESDKPVSGKVNDPMMPVAWVKSYTSELGKKGKVFTTTMGASQDLVSEGTRRMLVNAAYWATDLEAQIDEKRSVDLVGVFEPSPFKFGGFRKGMKPSDFKAE